MSWLVLAFRNGRLETVKLCRTKGSKNRIANYLNEHAAAVNRFRRNDHETVAVIEEHELIPLLKAHNGLPKHASKEQLERGKIKRSFKAMTVKYKIV